MASWLASAGMIGGSPAKGAQMVRDAAKADGVDIEKAGWEGRWEKTKLPDGSTGGMSKFLANQANWTEGLSLPKYLQSASLQDAAFKANADNNYRHLVRSGKVTANTSQEQLIAMYDAAHLGGAGNVVKQLNNPAAQLQGDANGDTVARRLAQSPAMAQALMTQFKPTNGSAPVAPPAAPVTPAAPVIAQTTTTVPAPALPFVPGTAATAIVMPKVPAVAAAQPVHEPLSSGDRSKGVEVNLPKPDISQDVKDRRIAHIVTGGMV